MLNAEEIRDFEPGVENEEYALRSEYEVSPDGKHVVLEDWYRNPADRDATLKLWVKYACRLIELFNLKPSKSLLKDMMKTVVAWYQAGYRLKDLKDAIKKGVFRTPTDIEDWLMVADSFPEDLLDFRKKDTSFSPRNNLPPADPETEEEEESFDYFTENIITCVDGDVPAEFLSCFETIREKEYHLMEYMHELKNRMNSICKRLQNSSPHEKKMLEKEKERLSTLLDEAKSHLISLKKETLEMFNLAYDDVIVLRRILHHERKTGHIKLPLRNSEGINEEVERLHIKLTQISALLGSDDPDLDREKLLEEKREVEKLLFGAKSDYEKRCEKIGKLISTVRRCGIDRGRYAYLISSEVKRLIRKLPPADALIFRIQLNNAWKERRKRLETLHVSNEKPRCRRTRKKPGDREVGA